MEGHAAGLDGSLHDDDQLELLLGEVGGVHVVERRLLVDHVDNLQRPHEEDAGLVAGVGRHGEARHLLGHLALRARAPPQDLG